MPLAFKIDENLPAEVAEILRKAGHDAISVLDQALGGAEDPDVARVCQDEHRVLMTLDLGFGDIRAYQPSDYPGIIVLRCKSQEKPVLLSTVERLVPLLESTAVAGTLWIVEEDRVRVRG